jgi:alpha-ribazole phosphatase
MTAFLLHLLRHGAPETPGRMMGRTDGAPTPAGIAACVDQAADLAFDRLIASDLARARLAGNAIAVTLSVPLGIDPRWRELDFGAWDGLSSADIDPSAIGRFWDDPDANPPPGGERWSALTARVGSAIADLAPLPTLVVSHGGAMRAALAVLCGFDQRQIWAFDLGYASLLSLKIWPGDTPSAQIVGLWP